jgi:hypothetical protein
MIQTFLKRAQEISMRFDELRGGKHLHCCRLGWGEGASGLLNPDKLMEGCATLMVEVKSFNNETGFSEILLHVYQITRCHNPEGHVQKFQVTLLHYETLS